MKVKVKLFAGLTRVVPGTTAGVPFERDLPGGSTVQDLARALNIPEGEARIVFVNGIAQPQSHALSDGDEVGVFPPIGGGSSNSD